MRIILFFLTLTINSYANEIFEIVKKWNFQTIKINKWNIKIESEISKDEVLKNQILQIFKRDLSLIVTNLPISRVKELRKIPIWVSNEFNYPLRANEKGAMVYHSNPKWLQKHFLPQELSKSVHLINPKEYIHTHKAFTTQPFATLHELTHGYLDLCLGENTTSLRRAYDNAIQSKLYQNIKRVDGSIVSKAYALKNAYEYFSELTESYFGKNDFFPFTKMELKKYDPVGYLAVQKAWESDCEIKI